MLFDTSVLIAHLRGDRRATDLLLSVPTKQRLASVLTRAEIEGGMRSSESASVPGLLGATLNVKHFPMFAGLNRAFD